MYLAFVYHRVLQKEKYGNDLALFDKHLDYLIKHFHFLSPGKPPKGPSVLLTFDDATVDFYFHVFPRLQEKNIPCLLAIPTGKIPSKVQLAPEKRLGFLKQHPSNESLPKEAYCSWEELKEMALSKSMHFACHTHSHIPCHLPIQNFQQEIIESKQMIEKQLNQAVNCFVYPYGKYAPKIHKTLQQHFKYLFRIGNSYNLNWNHPTQLYFRCNADNLSSAKDPLFFKNTLRYFFKMCVLLVSLLKQSFQ